MVALAQKHIGSFSQIFHLFPKHRIIQELEEVLLKIILGISSELSVKVYIFLQQGD